MSTDPLSPLDVLIPSRAEQLLERKSGAIAQVLDIAVNRMHNFDEDDRYPKSGELSSWHGRGLAPSAAHADPRIAAISAFGGAPGLRFVPTDEYDRADPRREPAFVAGFWFTPSEGTFAALDDTTWRESLSADVLVTLDDGEYGVRKLRYLGELLTVGATLLEQAEELGRWAEDSIDEVATLAQLPRP